MNPGTAIMMLILASFLNYGILKFLTTNVASIEVIKGKIGKKGVIGLRGERGEHGNQGMDADRKLLGNNDQLLGDIGEIGDKGTDANCELPAEKYCITEDGTLPDNMGSGSHMNLIGYRARNLENVCLFGYKPVVESGKTICRAPKLGNNPFKDCPVGRDNNCINHKTSNWNSNIVDKSSLQYFEPGSWAPNNKRTSLMNCDYKKDKIAKMTPAQFSAWTRLLAKRDCVGVPYNGTIIPPKKDTSNNLIWPNPPPCQQQIESTVGIGYFTEYSNSGNQCRKGIAPIGGNTFSNGDVNTKITNCECQPYPSLDLGSTCVVSDECSGRGTICMNNKCVEDCSVMTNKIIGTESTDPNDSMSQYKCYNVLGSECNNNIDCASGKCASGKCVDSTCGNKMTPFEFDKIYVGNEDDYSDQDINFNLETGYNNDIKGNAYQCFNNPTMAPTPAPSECPLGWPDVNYNRRDRSFSDCHDPQLNLDDTIRDSLTQTDAGLNIDDDENNDRIGATTDVSENFSDFNDGYAVKNVSAENFAELKK